MAHRLRLPALLRLLPFLPLVGGASVWGQGAAATPSTAVDVKSFQTLEDKWSVAYAARDQYGMEILLSPWFVDISAAGKVTARNGVLAAMVAGTLDGGQLVSIEQKAVDVRALGELAAVVDGTYVIHYKAPVAGTGGVGEMKTIDERGVFSQVWQRTRGGWACVHAQRTAVFDEPLSAGKPRAARKASDAELPFHIPLVYQGAQGGAQGGTPEAKPKPGDTGPAPQ